MLPIAERELRSAARDPRLHSRRLRWGMLQAGAAFVLLLFSSAGSKTGAAESFFAAFSRLALLLCLLEGVRKTSDAISVEKRDGTLGLLFLSTLSGADVVLGKLTGALVRSMSVLLPFLPILAISLLVGGTTPGEFWRVALVLALTLILSLSLCLLTSSCSREKSIAAALIALAAISILPYSALLSARTSILALVSPFSAFSAASDAAFAAVPARFWTAVTLLACGSALSLTLASFIVRRSWHDTAVRASQTRQQTRRSFRKRQLLDRNPVFWLSYSQKGTAAFAALATLLALAGVIPTVLLVVQYGESEAWLGLPALSAGVLCLLIWLRVALQSSSAMAESSRNGSLELLLSTPLTVDDVIKGHWLALWTSIRIPVYCLGVLIVSALLLGSHLSVAQASWTGKFVIELVLEIAVLGAVGMWMGLRAKTRAGAVASTIVIGGILPFVVCFFTILIQVVLLARALQQVNAILRRIRGGNPVNLEALLRSPSAPVQNLPPVIR